MHRLITEYHIEPFITPVGETLHCFLSHPDKFKNVEIYKSKLIVDKKSLEPLMNQCLSIAETFAEKHQCIDVNRMKDIGMPWSSEDSELSYLLIQCENEYIEDVLYVDCDNKPIQTFNERITDGSFIQTAGEIRLSTAFGGSLVLCIRAIKIISLKKPQATHDWKDVLINQPNH